VPYGDGNLGFYTSDGKLVATIYLDSGPNGVLSVRCDFFLGQSCDSLVVYLEHRSIRIFNCKVFEALFHKESHEVFFGCTQGLSPVRFVPLRPRPWTCMSGEPGTARHALHPKSKSAKIPNFRAAHHALLHSSSVPDLAPDTERPVQPRSLGSVDFRWRCCLTLGDPDKKSEKLLKTKRVFG
jgi:hypothetical protein